jgi:pulcherriminic acid synthase
LDFGYAAVLQGDFEEAERLFTGLADFEESRGGKKRIANRTSDDVSMSDEDVKAICSLLLAAGGETTDKAIASLFSNLLRHPEQLAAVRADRGLIPKAFAETLRYTPPVHMIMRQPAHDVPLGGGTIPAGSTVTCPIAAANRDPERYADPDTFDIFRDDLKVGTAFTAAADHLAFALGRHFCVGALLAEAEVIAGTNQLLDAMPDLRLAPGFVPRERACPPAARPPCRSCSRRPWPDRNGRSAREARGHHGRARTSTATQSAPSQAE